MLLRTNIFNRLVKLSRGERVTRDGPTHTCRTNQRIVVDRLQGMFRIPGPGYVDRVERWRTREYIQAFSFEMGHFSINQLIKIYIVPLQDTYSEALPTQAKWKRTVFSRWWN